MVDWWMREIRLEIAATSKRWDCEFSVEDGRCERLEGSVLNIDCGRGAIETRGTTRSGHEVLGAKSRLLEER